MNGHESVLTITGRRSHANSPVPMNAPPMIGPKTAIRSR
jgi:hypothetical protein